MARSLAYAFHNYVIYMLNEHPEDPNVIREAFRYFEEYVVENAVPKGIPMRDIYNQRIYEWYYGNILGFLYTLALQPELYLEGDENKKRGITKHQQRSCILEAYRIMKDHGVDHTAIDYYENTIYEYAKGTIESGTAWGEEPEHRLMLFLAEKGAKGVEEAQGRWVECLRGMLLRRKKRAVSAIEEWWFHIVSDPDTRPGARLLGQRAKAFHRMAVGAGGA